MDSPSTPPVWSWLLLWQMKETPTAGGWVVGIHQSCKKTVFVTGENQQLHPGQPGLLKTVDENLTCVLFKLCEQGLQVNNQTIHKLALHLSPAFKKKSLITKNPSFYALLNKLEWLIVCLLMSHKRTTMRHRKSFYTSCPWCIIKLWAWIAMGA